MIREGKDEIAGDGGGMGFLNGRSVGVGGGGR